jgi:hypothetical protein
MAKYTIVVDDLSRREGSPCNVCPVARALHKIPEFAGVKVSREWIEFPGKRHPDIKLPKMVTAFTEDYDYGDDDPQPFTFELEGPEAGQ